MITATVATVVTKSKVAEAACGCARGCADVAHSSRHSEGIRAGTFTLNLVAPLNASPHASCSLPLRAEHLDSHQASVPPTQLPNTSDDAFGEVSNCDLASQCSRLPVFARITDEEHRREQQLALACALRGQVDLFLADLSTLYARYTDILATLEKQRISPFRLQNAEGLAVNTAVTQQAFLTLQKADQLKSALLLCHPMLDRCVAAAGRLELGCWAEETDALLKETRHFLHLRHWSLSAEATRVSIKTSTTALC
ncbi:hypothetical protein THASP1DRAFT_30644 [Thamnocephalis sphaerospora]|uniref:Uncharacterized protein n=1 Tax=Thamnocephalis sphaerospora TaxID=78915 RepID=A0A4V1IWH1_9FUNG|nr:hypothetical protein THASP1DRAFT_30644 [Thamnocephalis sphaerospora]|eukprot:RKP07539.1 hypothetical protein THASP1DRAFT_30644 [Thamnocephalis sphaerospora]